MDLTKPAKVQDLAPWPCMPAQRESSEFRSVEYALRMASNRHDLAVHRVLAIDNPLARHK
jgi:hypothetical protein|eukprot:SAG25_NODE_956_length_4555_cov_2.152603_1_plen_60_part_00